MANASEAKNEGLYLDEYNYPPDASSNLRFNRADGVTVSLTDMGLIGTKRLSNGHTQTVPLALERNYHRMSLMVERSQDPKKRDTFEQHTPAYQRQLMRRG